MASIYHLLNRQIPAHIREQYPVFCKFIEYYYRWLQTRGFDKLEKVTNIDYECQAIAIKDCFDINDINVDPVEFAKRFIGYTIVNDRGVVAEIIGVDQSKLIIRYLTINESFELNDTLYVRSNASISIDQNKKYDRCNVSRVQTLPSAYIDHFSHLLDSDGIFDTNNANIALILKNIKQLYQSKGSEQALQYILKATKNVDSEIRYPWKQVLKPSDGRWQRQFAVNIQVDSATWHHIPTDFNTVLVEIPSTDPNNPDSTFESRTIVKLEIFGSQSENYDTEDWWWRRHNENEDGSYDPNRLTFLDNGAIDFESGYPNTYGRFGDRKITPFIRLYFEDDPKTFIGQYIKVVATNDETGQQYIALDGRVVSGVKGFDIVEPGRSWQVGQIFTASKESLWQIYNQPYQQVGDDGYAQSNAIRINDKGVLVQYSTDVPLIGRVTAVGDHGEIQSAEIVQLGDHLPSNASKVITVSPLFNNHIDPTAYQATIKLVYGPQTNVMGYFDDNSGMISDNDIRLQDNYYYQKFSYDIVANADPATYIEMAEKLHPAGTKMFTTYVLEADLDNESNFDVVTGAPLLTISLFDIAIVTDKLTKTIKKNLSDQSIIQDLLTLTTIKEFSDSVLINDNVYDRVYLTEIDNSYDDINMNYYERLFDGVNKSYGDTGKEKKVFINYQYHTTQSE